MPSMHSRGLQLPAISDLPRCRKVKPRQLVALAIPQQELREVIMREP